jgi:hypothetical protein
MATRNFGEDVQVVYMDKQFILIPVMMMMVTRKFPATMESNLYVSESIKSSL